MPRRTSIIALLAACAACGDGPRGGGGAPGPDAPLRLADELQAPERPPAGPAAPGPGGGRGDRHARASARRSPTVKRVEGTLAHAGERSVVIRQAGAPELTLGVAPGTTITVNGRPARLEGLREGAEVRAAYRTGSGGRPTALSIEARAAAGSGAPETSPGAAESGGG